jgi:hypothetical protein
MSVSVVFLLFQYLERKISIRQEKYAVKDASFFRFFQCLDGKVMVDAIHTAKHHSDNLFSFHRNAKFLN